MESSSSSQQDNSASQWGSKAKGEPTMPFADFKELYTNDLLRTENEMTSLASEITQFTSASTKKWGFEACLSTWNSLYRTLANSESGDSFADETWGFFKRTAPELAESCQDNRTWKNLIKGATCHRNRQDARSIYLAKIRERWGERVYEILQPVGVASILLRLCCAMCGVVPWENMQSRVQIAAFNRIAWGSFKDNSAPLVKPEDFWRALVLPEGTSAPSAKALENIRCQASKDGLLEPLSTDTSDETESGPPKKQHRVRDAN